MLHVVLYQPEMPANTANIGRTCAVANAKLHLIRPLGFLTTDKMIKRASANYWQLLDVTYYDSLQELFDLYKDGEFYFLTKFGEHTYSNFDYSDKEKDYFFVFGKESAGLPEEVRLQNQERCLRIPMKEAEGVRSLNVSNVAAILVYEALRQQNFPNIK